MMSCQRSGDNLIPCSKSTIESNLVVNEGQTVFCRKLHATNSMLKLGELNFRSTIILGYVSTIFVELSAEKRSPEPSSCVRVEKKLLDPSQNENTGRKEAKQEQTKRQHELISSPKRRQLFKKVSSFQFEYFCRRDFQAKKLQRCESVVL